MLQKSGNHTLHRQNNKNSCICNIGRVLLGPPWSSEDACSLCSGITGVESRILSVGDEESYAEAESCHIEAVKFLNTMGPETFSHYLYRCPHGIQCVCIPLDTVPDTNRSCFWVRSCRYPVCGGCSYACDSQHEVPAECPSAYEMDDFQLALNMLRLMSDHVQFIETDALSCFDESGLSAHQKELVREVCRAIHERGEEADLKLTPIASRNMVSVGYLCTLFVREMGVAFRAYLQSWRLYRAKELLAEGELSIKEIAVRSGYNDPNRLRIAFKTATGLPPREWRERRLQPD